MKFEWREDQAHLAVCQEVFMALGAERAMYMSHYDLELETDVPAEHWKEFLMHPRVADWMRGELELLKAVKLRKVIEKSDAESRSVGAASMINALGKALETNSGGDGQIFVYMHVPLNESELDADNVHTVDPELFEFSNKEEDE